MIGGLSQLVSAVKERGERYHIAVAMGEDTNTLGAASRAVAEGFARVTLVGNPAAISEACRQAGARESDFGVVECADPAEAAKLSVGMVRSGEADILMKGLLGTDHFLKAVMDKERGLMVPGAVMSYVCAVEIPAYHKLLFITDTAVIPFPDLGQKIAMAGYAIEMAHRFGIASPRVALIGASEKLSRHFPSSNDYPEMVRMSGEGDFGNCIMDGPLDLFLAVDPEAGRIKGVKSPVEGNADILLFPSLEACNPFYKGLMQFAGGELAGLLRGTTHPVVLMSRSESENSKYYCIALACLMADK